MLNCIEVREYIFDPKDLCKLSQVGVDLTIDSIKQVLDLTESGIVYWNPVNGIYTDKTEIISDSYVPLTFRNNQQGRSVIQLSPGVYSVTFDQGLLKLPNNITALLRHRSSLLRIGGCIPGGIYDPGFEVEQIGAMMFLNLPIIIERHARIAQMTMNYNTKVPEEFMYNGQFQGEKDVK